jgi:hypothetical protein
MPLPRQVTAFLFGRFSAIDVTGMARAHTRRLAVLFVCDGFVVWSDGRIAWWLVGRSIVVSQVAEPDELWRSAYGRYREISGGTS